MYYSLNKDVLRLKVCIKLNEIINYDIKWGVINPKNIKADECLCH